MDIQTAHPVYTVDAECQDCYKCLRQCPVKAIRVAGGRASIVPELCVACGHCVAICPAKAKKFRDSLPLAKSLLVGGAPVYVSLAPSWVAEFPGLPVERMVAALRTLGFAGVGETALGAQEVSLALARSMGESPPGQRLMISSACPAMVEFVAKYLPRFRSAITGVASPLHAHARLLKAEFGESAAVVFIGPCAAKKLEVGRYPDSPAAALTFVELRQWWREAGVVPDKISTSPDDHFVPSAAAEGALYPVNGGMLETIRAAGAPKDVEMATINGVRNLENALEGVEPESLPNPVFIECLACEGGCVGGPAMGGGRHGLAALLAVRRNAPVAEDCAVAAAARSPRVPAAAAPVVSPGGPPIMPGEASIRSALALIGKFKPEDEANCGGCGYDQCRQLAAAIAKGDAEPVMCVSHNRRLAQKKANALLSRMPCGIAIADAQLRIIECNRVFAEMFGEAAALAFDARPGMEGASLVKFLPKENLFRAVLRHGQDVRREHLPVDGRLFDVTIFPIEPNQVVGVLVVDVTVGESRRGLIANRAREVISKNMAAAQEIACQLGEHMAETEMLLRAIATDFADTDADPQIETEPDGGDGA